jgi:hypothetical protein
VVEKTFVHRGGARAGLYRPGRHRLLEVIIYAIHKNRQSHLVVSLEATGYRAALRSGCRSLDVHGNAVVCVPSRRDGPDIACMRLSDVDDVEARNAAELSGYRLERWQEPTKRRSSHTPREEHLHLFFRKERKRSRATVKIIQLKSLRS